ncbi:MAG: hypothetical protein Q8R13_06235, partial [bacterium]|nr:hypothetical protein [bacterium]
MALRDHFPTFQGVRQRLHFGDGLGRMRARLTAIRPRGRRLALVSGLAALLAIIAVIFVFYAPPRLSLVGPTETRPGGFTDVQLCTHLAEYHVLGSAGIALATGRTAQARGHTPCVAVNSGFW